MRTVCHDANVINITLRRKWTRRRVTTAGWSPTVDDNHPLYGQFARAYSQQGSAAALMNRKLTFYDGISYVMRDDSESVRVHINVGDIVDVSEEREGVAYAKVIAIIRHQATDGRYFAFFLFEWFTALATPEATLECLVYERQ